jgi:hypothetical protein
MVGPDLLCKGDDFKLITQDHATSGEDGDVEKLS